MPTWFQVLLPILTVIVSATLAYFTSKSTANRQLKHQYDESLKLRELQAYDLLLDEIMGLKEDAKTLADYLSKRFIDEMDPLDRFTSIYKQKDRFELFITKFERYGEYFSEDEINNIRKSSESNLENIYKAIENDLPTEFRRDLMHELNSINNIIIGSKKTLSRRMEKIK